MIHEETVQGVVDFHGHMCPGLAMGIRAAEVALAEIGPHSGDEEVVAIVETDMCGVDAIQYMTGCTFGKGNLIHRDYGKNAYTFVRRSDGRALRISPKAGGFPRPPGWHELFAKVRSGMARPEERKQFWALQQAGSERILASPLEDLYSVSDVDVEVPPAARVLASLDCARCGEPVMESRIRRLDGRDLCQPCFDATLAGHTSLAPPTTRQSVST